MQNKLEKPYYRECVNAYLKELEITARYKDKSVSINYDGISTIGSARLMAYGGFMKITVAQHYYVKHRILLKWPNLQCVMVKMGKQHAYYPLELLYVD